MSVLIVMILTDNKVFLNLKFEWRCFAIRQNWNWPVQLIMFNNSPVLGSWLLAKVWQEVSTRCDLSRSRGGHSPASGSPRGGHSPASGSPRGGHSPASGSPRLRRPPSADKGRLPKWRLRHPSLTARHVRRRCSWQRVLASCTHGQCRKYCF